MSFKKLTKKFLLLKKVAIKNKGNISIKQFLATFAIYFPLANYLRVHKDYNIQCRSKLIISNEI